MSPVELVRTSLAEVTPANSSRALRTVLGPVEAKAVAGLVQGREREIVAIATARATALASREEGPEALSRSLSRVVQITEQQMAAMAGLHAERITQRDDAVRLLDRALTNAAQRYKWFVEELRLQSQCGRRAVVMVAQGPVAIAARE
jgi:hypothetical protein